MHQRTFSCDALAVQATLIAKLEARPVDIELTEPFGIATGSQPLARNVFVELTLGDGTRGMGEAAPFPAVNGETREDALIAIERARPVLLGADARRWRALAGTLGEAVGGAPSARCALETALLDALARHGRISLWSMFGGAETELETDITIVTGTVSRAAEAARAAVTDGFRRLKVKVGGGDLAHDVARLVAILGAAPSAELILDANAALSSEEAIALTRALGTGARRIVLFEQPTVADDLDGLRAVWAETRIPVAADESAQRAADVVSIAAHRAAQVVNVKIMKSGVVEALDMAAVARAHGLGLMVGGMVESPLAMTVSACLAAGLGGFEHVDLDTPLFMADPPTQGGFRRFGPRLGLSHIELGHGVEVLGPP